MCPGVGLEGWLGCFAHPLGAVVCRGHAQYPAGAPIPYFAPGSSEVVVGWSFNFLFFGFSAAFVQFAPAEHAVIFS